MNRRHTDHPDAPRRRREDELDRLRREGSENFRRYRRRAFWAFAILAIGNVLALYLTIHNAEVARDELARAGAIVAARGCDADNDTRRGIREFVANVSPRLRLQVIESFPRRDCAAEARPLLEQLSR